MRPGHLSAKDHVLIGIVGDHDLLEAGFLGIMIFGWQRVPPVMHPIATHEGHGTFKAEDVAEEPAGDLGEDRPNSNSSGKPVTTPDAEVQHEEPCPEARVVIRGNIVGAQP